uniref:SUEL-type lectin domain-containing protein n=1 Tax=Steinernema glaseri TaxID=37863 RepID=A0A1I7Z2D0_9BILA
MPSFKEWTSAKSDQRIVIRKYGSGPENPQPVCPLLPEARVLVDHKCIVRGSGSCSGRNQFGKWPQRGINDRSAKLLFSGSHAVCKKALGRVLAADFRVDYADCRRSAPAGTTSTQLAPETPKPTSPGNCPEDPLCAEFGTRKVTSGSCGRGGEGYGGYRVHFEDIEQLEVEVFRSLC